jgi:hypothetical protein
MQASFHKFDNSLFWDVKIESIDIEKHARFIIERVISRGNLQNWNLLKEIYGKEKIKNEAVQIKSLDRKTVSFLSAYFDLRAKDFRCCS